MASNRPLFDDEDLPNWLKAAGITYGGPKGQVPSRPAAPSQPDSDDLGWLDEEPPDQGSPAAQAAGPFVPPSEESLPWLQDAEPAQPVRVANASPWGETVPWESEPVQSAADESPLGTPPWQPPRAPDENTSQDRTGVTGMLPWRQGTSEDQSANPLDDQGRPPWEVPGGETPAAQPGEPDWLQDFSLADAQPDAQPDAQSAQPPAQPSAGAEPDFGWLDEVPAESTPQPVSSADDDLSWLDAGPVETPAEVPAVPSQPAPAFDDLSWLDAAAQDKQPPTPVQPTPPPAVGEDLGWLDTAYAEVEAAAAQPAPEPPAAPTPTPPPPAAPPAPEPSAAPIKPLKRLPTKPEPRAETPAEPPTAPAPIRRLPSTQPVQPVQPPQPVQPAQPAQVPPRPIQKLPRQQERPPVEPDLSNMTYEEWEQQQIAKEQEALSDPADKLLDEVPEWFSQTDKTTTPPAPAQSGPEFLPDWYMGMEEQSADAAPDWFNSTDLSGTPLAGPETVETPPPEPAVAAPGDEVPDWFKGAGLEGMDFDSMFGVQPTEPEPSSAAEPAPSSVPPVPPVPPAPPAAEVPESAEPQPLDWMNSDQPDLSQWTADENAQPTSDMPIPEPPAFKSEVPAPELPDLDWLTDEESMSAEPAAAELAQAATVSPETIDWNLVEQNARPNEVEIPDWMYDQLEPAATEPAQTAPETPDTPPEPFATEEPEEPEPVESDVPAWMRDMAPISPNPPLPTDASPELDWLSDFEESSPVLAEPPAAPAEKPTAQPVASAVPAPEPTAEPSGAPSPEVDLNAPVDIDELLGLSGEGGPFTPVMSELPSAAPVIPVDENRQALARMEDFDLDELLGPEPDESTAPQPEIDLDELAAEPLPPAVRAEPGEPAEPPRVGRLRRVSGTPPQTAESPRPREELPEWLEEMRPTEMPIALHIGDQEVRIQEKPVVQMNDRLRQLREHGKPFRKKRAESPAPSAGPLSGITGAIETIPEAIQPGTVSIPTPLTAAESQAKRVKLIQRMLELEDAMFRERAVAEEDKQAKPAAAARPRVKIDRYILTLLLAVALIVPFFVDGLNIIPAPALDRLTPAQNRVAQVVDTIQPQQPVLVAFEYGPTAAGELDDLARTILRDIIKRGGHPVIVSTNPVGAMRGQIVMTLLGTRAADLQLMNRTDPLVNRQDYVVLRYLAGGSAGARSIATAILSGGFQQQIVFSTDIEGKPSGLNDISGLKISPAFVLAETADDVRNWAEQYQAPTGEKPFTIVFLTSASASPVADTYVRSTAQTDQHLVGPLVGLRDTMTYQAVRQPAPASAPASGPASAASSQKLALQRWQSIGLSALLAGVIILIGMTLNMIRGLQRRRRR